MKHPKAFPTAAALRALSILFLFSLHATGSAQPKASFTQQEIEYWAFQPIKRQPPPISKGDARVRNPVDAFVGAQLGAKNIQLSPEADKIVLLRRAALDLLGLPPTPEEIRAFLADQSPDAFDKVIDRLLASPRYGERWARHWLDLARYAESEGFKADETRPNAWRYRDYVIRSFNQDKAYDRFIKEQIAGDELWPNDSEALIATGFNRHYPDESNARNLMQRRQEILNDITDTVGAVFTGMTYACARCHNHKFDPILQTDYYRLQAFFANAAATDNMVLAPSAAVRQYHEKLAVWEQKTLAIRQELDSIEEPKRKELIGDFVVKYPDPIQATLTKRESDRTPFECQMVAKARLYLDPSSHQYIASSTAVGGLLKGETKKRWEVLKTELQKFADLYPSELPVGTGIMDVSRAAPDTFVLRRGIYDAQTEEVEPGFLTILKPRSAQVIPPAGVNSTGRRAALANILTDPENPLTARVMVNRMWHYHFGRGIVGTPSDFGARVIDPPTLPFWTGSHRSSFGVAGV